MVELVAAPGDDVVAVVAHRLSSLTLNPCLRATARRTLDEATAEQIGDFLVLEWRGKRREILYRPE